MYSFPLLIIAKTLRKGHTSSELFSKKVQTSTGVISKNAIKCAHHCLLFSKKHTLSTGDYQKKHFKAHFFSKKLSPLMLSQKAPKRSQSYALTSREKPAVFITKNIQKG
jgi:hypothetical protein